MNERQFANQRLSARSSLSRTICLVAIAGWYLGFMGIASGQYQLIKNFQGKWHLQTEFYGSKDISLSAKPLYPLQIPTTMLVTGSWGGKDVSGHLSEGNFVLVTTFSKDLPNGSRACEIIMGKIQTATSLSGVVVSPVRFRGHNAILEPIGQSSSTPFVAKR